MSQDEPIPVMMRLMASHLIITQWKDCIFTVKLRCVCGAKYSSDPLVGIEVKLPHTTQQQSSDPMPTTGAFILTLIGKWNDIEQYNYPALKYTITYLHDHNTNNQATFDALQEMGRHINACFTHPIAQQMIIKATGQLSKTQLNIAFGLVTNVDRTQNNHPTTIINPCDRTQSIILNPDPSCRHTPSVGWLCLFVYLSSYYSYPLPIVDLSQHTQFMTTYNLQDLPPAEAVTYNALLDTWQNEKCTKELSYCIPRLNQLNPYTYVEAWNSVIQPIKDAEARTALVMQTKQEGEEEQRQQQFAQHIKYKSTQQFEEWKRLFLLQQQQQVQNDMYNHLYDTKLSEYVINNTHNNTNNNDNSFNTTTTTINQTSFISSLLNNNNKHIDDNCDANSDDKDNNNKKNASNTNILPLSPFALQHTLFNEYYYKQYIKSQLDDLTIMNRLQYYQYLSSSSSGTTYRPRPHIALPLPSLPSSTTTNTSSSTTTNIFSSSSTTTSSSTIDTLIELATSLPLPPPSPQSTTTAALITYTNNNATNSANVMDNMGDNKNNNINNTNQPTITIPQQQTTTFNTNNSSRQQLVLLQEQYNNILDQKHILIIQYDDLINKYNTILQTNETNNKQITTLEEQLQTLHTQIIQLQTQITGLKEQIASGQQQMILLQSTHQEQIQTLQSIHQDEIITLKEEHENEIITLKEECHRKQLEAKDIVIATYNNKSNNNTTTTQHQHHHLVNQISFLQQQLESTNTMYQQQLQSKDKQLESKDKQLESKDQQITVLMQMLAEANVDG